MPSGRRATSGSPSAGARHAPKEPALAQISSLVGFFIWLFIFKSFFLPLFIIPTGSMAETLYGAHAAHSCPNCGVSYVVGLAGAPPQPPPVLQCPNCRWQEYRGPAAELPHARARGLSADDAPGLRLWPRAGDRIAVHGWTYVLGGVFGPQRWDVAVFRVPSDGQTNYIKRLIGLPGETIELIDGDVFITDPRTGRTQIARKTEEAARSLWFPYFDQDFPPRRPAAQGTYHPRWVAVDDTGAWSGLETRRLRFAGRDGRPAALLFVTQPGDTRAAGWITDIYGYNGAAPARPHLVTDTRLSCEVEAEGGAAGGWVELSSSKHEDYFFARLYFDGDGRAARVTLEHAVGEDGAREVWGEQSLRQRQRPVRLALSNADYVVRVEVDGRAVLRSRSEQYDIDPQTARRRAAANMPSRLMIAAQNVRATLTHVRIERDVYYTSDVQLGDRRTPAGTQGHPLRLGPDEYFVLGDNSPASLDARFSFAQGGMNPVGPHLRAAFKAGRYQLGTVPADQLIGPAFFVYWPGTDALLPHLALPGPLNALNQVPSPGRARWIH